MESSQAIQCVLKEHLKACKFVCDDRIMCSMKKLPGLVSGPQFVYSGPPTSLLIMCSCSVRYNRSVVQPVCSLHWSFIIIDDLISFVWQKSIMKSERESSDRRLTLGQCRGRGRAAASPADRQASSSSYRCVFLTEAQSSSAGMLSTKAKCRGVGRSDAIQLSPGSCSSRSRRVHTGSYDTAMY